MKKTPATTAKRQPDHTKLTPRLKRLLVALYSAKSGLTREEADRALPASNAPEYIRQLKARFRLEIPCELVPFTTIDGRRSKRGVYRLTEDDRQRVRTLL
ncbi:hypothetical protein [Marinobacter nauticus]|uniref:hypothetical protein n=1 Tax=Marinobacter nauticus TaxID=2743 RepID=UPI001C990D43|nr:hypothetical protein [Marinobacter nauticus]MBY5963765.1 hypothetical protein [Marinobacter nauticus]